jgi:ethanolamine utilization protein EutQ
VKSLITINSLEDSISDGKSSIYIDKNTIITPAALDMIKEKSIRIERGQDILKNDEDIDPDYNLIYKIVKKMLSENNCIKKEDNSGIIHINSPVNLEPTYKNKNVYIKDILNSRETSSMCAGFMFIENTKYAMKIKNDEIEYIAEGEGEIVTKDGTNSAKKGDTVYIPKNCEISWDVKEKIKIFYVSC